MPTFGEILAREVKFRQPRRTPWQKSQVVQVTAVKPTKLSDGNLGNPVKETMVIHKPFMEALGTAQGRHPGWQLQVKTIDTVPDWRKPTPCDACDARPPAEELVEVIAYGESLKFCKKHVTTALDGAPQITDELIEATMAFRTEAKS